MGEISEESIIPFANSMVSSLNQSMPITKSFSEIKTWETLKYSPMFMN